MLHWNIIPYLLCVGCDCHVLAVLHDIHFQTIQLAVIYDCGAKLLSILSKLNNSRRVFLFVFPLIYLFSPFLLLLAVCLFQVTGKMYRSSSWVASTLVLICFLVRITGPVCVSSYEEVLLFWILKWQQSCHGISILNGFVSNIWQPTELDAICRDLRLQRKPLNIPCPGLWFGWPNGSPLSIGVKTIQNHLCMFGMNTHLGTTKGHDTCKSMQIKRRDNPNYQRLCLSCPATSLQWHKTPTFWLLAAKAAAC